MPAVAANSVEWNAEDLIIQKMKTNADIAARDFRHHQTDTAAAMETIVARAVKGERSMEGVKPWIVDCYVTFSSGTLSTADADKVAAAISESVYNEAAFVAVSPDIMFASVEPGSETTRDDTRKTRRRVVKFPMLIKLIS